MAGMMSNVPRMVYGTAWKQDRTRELVSQAISAGFRAIDTAAQPKHYQEDLVGQGIRDVLLKTDIARSDLYIQTKFTSIGGQDPSRMPYDAAASIEEQVRTSMASSLNNLRHSVDEASYLDCVVLHSPLPNLSQTLQVWRILESYVPHSVKSVGISNVYQLSTLQGLYENATIKPCVVQNRFCRETDYGKDIRAFCDVHGITYQSFWTLTANPHLLKSPPVQMTAAKAGVSPAVALYHLVLSLGQVSVLNGTTSQQRMQDDITGVFTAQTWARDNGNMMSRLQQEFNGLLA